MYALLRGEEVLIGSLGTVFVNFAFDSACLETDASGGYPTVNATPNDELYDDARGFRITRLFSPYFSL